MVTIPTHFTSQLDAVNILLASIAESPVSSLDPAEAVDVANAIQTLNETDLAVQAVGWWFNREYTLKLSPQSDGSIPLPNQTLMVTKSVWSNMSATPCKIVERAQKLYDNVGHTFIFTQAVCVDCVVRIGWDDLPEVVRRYITIRAAQTFQMRNQGSSSVAQITKDEVDQALATVQRYEGGSEQPNQITDNASMQRLIGGFGVRRRAS